MAYFPPAGDAAIFETLSVDFPRPCNSLGFETGGDYTAPVGDAINAQFPAITNWSAPAGSAVDFVLPAAWPSSFIGNGAVTVDVVASGSGTHPISASAGDGAASVDASASGSGAHGVAGVGAAIVSPSADGAGAHGVAGNGAASIGFGVEGSATVLRYELRGEVRLQGVLVNRRVRAYRRDTGAMIAEADTVAGRFAVHAGFSAAECYIVPIDLSETADDWSPPVANRVMPVLAMDSA